MKASEVYSFVKIFRNEARASDVLSIFRLENTVAPQIRNRIANLLANC